MIFKIVNPVSLEIECSYEDSERRSWGGSWGQFPHLPVPAELDPDCVIAQQDGVETTTVVDQPEIIIPAVTHTEEAVVIDTPEQVIPGVTHEEVVVDTPEQIVPAVTHEEIIIDVPESIDPETQEVIPAVTHVEVVIDVPEQTIPAVTHVEVVIDTPEEIIPAVTHTETVTIVDVPEQTIPAVTHTEERPVYSLVEDAALLAAKALRTKQSLVSEAYGRMDAAVYGEMALVFGTTKSDSATAFHETWKLMAASPSLFATEGLLAEKEVGAFHVGDALDTEQKVVDYANARIYEANTYSVYRMKRIKQFRDERAQILAEGV